MADTDDEHGKRRLNPAGRVRHGHDGRAIWEWAVETGRHALDSTSRLLRRLDAPGLSLEEDDKPAPQPQSGDHHRSATPEPPQAPVFGGPKETDPLAGSRQNFNPYDSRVPARRPAPPLRAQPSRQSPARRTTKPGLLARLFGKR